MAQQNYTFARFSVVNSLGRVEGVTSMQSVFVMDEIKHSYALPIDESAHKG